MLLLKAKIFEEKTFQCTNCHMLELCKRHFAHVPRRPWFESWLKRGLEERAHNFFDHLIALICKVVERRSQCLADQGDLESAGAELGEQPLYEISAHNPLSNETNQWCDQTCIAERALTLVETSAGLNQKAKDKFKAGIEAQLQKLQRKDAMKESREPAEKRAELSFFTGCQETVEGKESTLKVFLPFFRLFSSWP